MGRSLSLKGCAEVFRADGSLRDVRVRATSLADWQKVLDLLSSRYPARYLVDGCERERPRSAAEAFSTRARADPVMSFEVGGLRVNCHFFESEVLELDLQPSEVASEERFAALQELLRSIGDLLGKPVDLTRENAPELVMMRYDPANRAFHVMKHSGR